jgi:hypothetical protein
MPARSHAQRYRQLPDMGRLPTVEEIDPDAAVDYDHAAPQSFAAPVEIAAPAVFAKSRADVLLLTQLDQQTESLLDCPLLRRLSRSLLGLRHQGVIDFDIRRHRRNSCCHVYI